MVSFILPVCGIVILTNIVEENQKYLNSHGLLASLGKNSLEVYFIHFFLLEIIPHQILDCYGIVYLQIVVLFALPMACIGLSLVLAKLIHHSEFLNLILLGKGTYLKKIMSKIEWNKFVYSIFWWIYIRSWHLDNMGERFRTSFLWAPFGGRDLVALFKN